MRKKRRFCSCHTVAIGFSYKRRWFQRKQQQKIINNNRKYLQIYIPFIRYPLIAFNIFFFSINRKQLNHANAQVMINIFWFMIYCIEKKKGDLSYILYTLLSYNRELHRETVLTNNHKKCFCYFVWFFRFNIHYYWMRITYLSN